MKVKTQEELDQAAVARLARLECLTCQGTGFWLWELSRECPDCLGNGRQLIPGGNLNQTMGCLCCNGTRRIPKSVAEAVLALLQRRECVSFDRLEDDDGNEVLSFEWQGEQKSYSEEGPTHIQALESAIMAARGEE